MARAAVCLAVFLLAALASATSNNPLTAAQKASHGATIEEEKRILPAKQDEGELKAVSKAVQAGELEHQQVYNNIDISMKLRIDTLIYTQGSGVHRRYPYIIDWAFMLNRYFLINFTKPRIL
uniref:Uncharacterized protein n=1 Tax=Leersia perrieri TaxID=77586 RepID=A0A0D9WDW1_9ORYZ